MLLYIQYVSILYIYKDIIWKSYMRDVKYLSIYIIKNEKKLVITASKSSRKEEEEEDQPRFFFSLSLVLFLWKGSERAEHQKLWPESDKSFSGAGAAIIISLSLSLWLSVYR